MSDKSESIEHSNGSARDESETEVAQPKTGCGSQQEAQPQTTGEKKEATSSKSRKSRKTISTSTANLDLAMTQDAAMREVANHMVLNNMDKQLVTDTIQRLLETRQFVFAGKGTELHRYTMTGKETAARSVKKAAEWVMLEIQMASSSPSDVAEAPTTSPPPAAVAMTPVPLPSCVATGPVTSPATSAVSDVGVAAGTLVDMQTPPDARAAFTKAVQAVAVGLQAVSKAAKVYGDECHLSLKRARRDTEKARTAEKKAKADKSDRRQNADREAALQKELDTARQECNKWIQAHTKAIQQRDKAIQQREKLKRLAADYQKEISDT